MAAQTKIKLTFTTIVTLLTEEDYHLIQDLKDKDHAAITTQLQDGLDCVDGDTRYGDFSGWTLDAEEVP